MKTVALLYYVIVICNLTELSASCETLTLVNRRRCENLMDRGPSDLYCTGQAKKPLALASSFGRRAERAFVDAGGMRHSKAARHLYEWFND